MASLAATKSKYLMFALFYEEDEDNDFFKKLVEEKELDWSYIKSGDEGIIEDYWTYIGSTTYDGCIEDYIWVISTEIEDVSEERVQYFKNYLVGQANARDVKPIGTRTVYLVGDDDDFSGILTLVGSLIFAL
jgi:carbonic anhydrase